MTLKETYEKMSDEELLEKFKHFQRYRDESKLIILEELRKRKLVGEKEIEKKLKRIEEPENINDEKETKNKKVNNSWAAQYGATRFIAIFLFNSFYIFTFIILNFCFGYYTLSWQETDARIVELIKRVEIVKTNRNHVESTHERYAGDIVYEYNISGTKYTNDKIYYNKSGEVREKSILLESKSKGDILKIKYNPKKPKESVVIGYSIKEFFQMTSVGLVFLFIYFLLIKKARKEKLKLIFEKKLIAFLVVIEVIVLLLFLQLFI